MSTQTVQVAARKSSGLRQITGIEVIEGAQGPIDVYHDGIRMPTLTYPGNTGAVSTGSMQSYLVPQVRARFNDGFGPAHQAMMNEMPSGNIRLYVNARGELNFEVMYRTLAAVTASAQLPAPVQARAEAEMQQTFSATVHVEAGAEAEIEYSIRDKAANIVGKHAGRENALFFLREIDDRAWSSVRQGGIGWYPVAPANGGHGLALSVIGSLNTINNFRDANGM